MWKILLLEDRPFWTLHPNRHTPKNSKVPPIVVFSPYSETILSGTTCSILFIEVPFRKNVLVEEDSAEKELLAAIHQNPNNRNFPKTARCVVSYRFLEYCFCVSTGVVCSMNVSSKTVELRRKTNQCFCSLHQSLGSPKCNLNMTFLLIYLVTQTQYFRSYRFSIVLQSRRRKLYSCREVNENQRVHFTNCMRVW